MSETPAPSQTPATSKKRLGRIWLFGLLALMLLALAQDRLRARPAVQRAYHAVAQLNQAKNRTGLQERTDRSQRIGVEASTTHEDVQQVLGRAPSKLIDYGPYKVEVYSWRAGLPWRTHDYYAVYEKGDDRLLLLTHYAFRLPRYQSDPRLIRVPDLPRDGLRYGSVQGQLPPDDGLPADMRPSADLPGAELPLAEPAEREPSAEASAAGESAKPTK